MRAMQRDRVGKALSTASRTQYMSKNHELPFAHRPHNNLNPASCQAPSGSCRQQVNKGNKVLPRSSCSSRETYGTHNVWRIRGWYVLTRRKQKKDRRPEMLEEGMQF